MKLVEEIDGLGRDWRLTFEALEQDLPYMDAIIKESLRVYSPAFMTLRAAEEDLKIDGKPSSMNNLLVSMLVDGLDLSRISFEDAADL